MNHYDNDKLIDGEIEIRYPIEKCTGAQRRENRNY